MPKENHKGLFIIVLVIGIILLAGVSVFLFRKHSSTPPVVEEQHPDNYKTEEKIPSPSDIIMLPDSTRIYALDKESPSVIRGKNGYEAVMDGDMFYDIPGSKETFVIRTRLLKLTVKGKAAFRVIAYRKDEGEEVQVLHGNILAEKSYKSDFPEPETLKDDNLLMINRSIDLMEREENLDTHALRKWKKEADLLPVRHHIQP